MDMVSSFHLRQIANLPHWKSWYFHMSTNLFFNQNEVDAILDINKKRVWKHWFKDGSFFVKKYVFETPIRKCRWADQARFKVDHVSKSKVLKRNLIWYYGLFNGSFKHNLTLYRWHLLDVLHGLSRNNITDLLMLIDISKLRDFSRGVF